VLIYSEYVNINRQTDKFVHFQHFIRKEIAK